MSFIFDIVIDDFHICFAMFTFKVFRTPFLSRWPIGDHVVHHDRFPIKIALEEFRTG